MDKGELFSIGEMSRLFHLSVSTLRHYEAVGLLKPAFVDPMSGYRYYRIQQFETLNTIRYLRQLDMPLNQIREFVCKRNLKMIEQMLTAQQAEVRKKIEDLKRTEQKISNRLHQLKDAQQGELNSITLVSGSPQRLAWVRSPKTFPDSMDLEKPIRQLEQKNSEAVVFLGKVGMGISPDDLNKGRYAHYTRIFLLLDTEDDYTGPIEQLPAGLQVVIRFHGGHEQAERYYTQLMAFIENHHLAVTDYSREISLIDEGVTQNPDQFVTEITIPVKAK